MNQFWQTLLIATIPSAITAVLSFLAAMKASNTQIKAIKEQNKADIEKLIEQNKADIEKMKEQYKIQADMEEKSHDYQLETMKIKNEIEMEKCLENAIGKIVLSIVNSFLENKDNEKGSVSENNADLKDE